ncbi:hypothetical protein BD770DRAFT_422299 [Pilaira anomala]|nr:hypothetical protein BD770DRAFT_422299 [Pilaira anomala]
MKRPRAPIACYRCHHKKVRCDGIHPNCTRCLSTGVLCAYPSSRRSRNTQPTNVDPFIDNLSQLEARIRRIETDLESQRVLVRTVCATDNSLRDTSAASANSSGTRSNTNNTLTSRMLKTEKDLQESRSIVAQLRLRGEQRAARGRRAAAAAAAAATVAAGSSATGTSSATSNSATPGPEKNTAHSGKNNSNKESGPNTAKRNKIRASKKDITTITNPNNEFNTTSSSSPPFYFSQSNSSSPVDFINPTPSYYFPYSPNPQHYNSDMTPICSNASSAPFTMMVSDWPLLNDLPQNTTVHNNGFVDPMIIAAAEAHQHGIAPPLLSVSSYMAVDEDNSIMAARAKSLSHLPPQQHMMSIPGLQPSSSSTSTCSNNSNFANYNVYDTGYTNFMDTNSSDNMMMMDQQQQNIR